MSTLSQLLGKILSPLQVTGRGPDLIAVCVRDTEGMNAEKWSKLKEIAEASSAVWLQQLLPHTLLLFFPLNRSGAADSERVIAEASALVRDDPLFAQIRIGRSEGRAIATYEADGRLTEAPLGQFISDAIRATVAQ